MDRISVVVPIGGRFSFFVYACLENAFRMCGNRDALDFVFLTARSVDPNIEKAFELARKQFSFRIISAPFEASNHLRLLDWAVRHADLTNWFVTQHCDFFWKQRNWLTKVIANTNDSLTILHLRCGSGCYFEGANIPITGDYFGVYNRKKLVSSDLYFTWGSLGKEVSVSRPVHTAIKSGALCGINGRKIQYGEFVDGSQAMAWELFVRERESIKQLDEMKYIHLMGFYRISEWIERVGSLFICNCPIDLKHYAYYSYLTSFYFEKSELGHMALPWSWFKRFAETYQIDTKPAERIGKWLGKYGRTEESIGMSRHDISAIILRERRFPTKVVTVI